MLPLPDGPDCDINRAGGMEATLFTGWIYDFLKPHALELKVGHPNCKNLSIPKEEARNGSSCNR